MLEAGSVGETYNVGGWNEKPNPATAGRVDVLALVLQHDEQAVLAAVDMALKSGVVTKTHVLNLLHRLIDGNPSSRPPSTHRRP